MVSGTISLFCSKCFSPFPHGTCSLSVSQEYLALPDGPGRFRQDSTCPALLRIPLKLYSITCTRLSLSMAGLSNPFYFLSKIYIVVLQPQQCRNNVGLGYFPFARRYWGNHFCFLFLQVLRCFSSLRLPPILDDISSIYRVAPFGNLRIKGYLHLPEAYRSLSRPSSPLRAKASAIRPYLLISYLYFFSYNS